MLLPPAGTPRVLAIAAFANAVGNGAYLAVSVLFVTRSVGLTPAQMAVGLSVGAVAGMLLTTPLGHVADLYGAKRTQIIALLALAAAFTGLLFINSLGQFALLAGVIAVGEATVKSANGAMIATAAPPGERLRLRAYVRSITNAGIGFGALVGGVPLLLDSRAAYVTVILGDAVTSVLAAVVLTRAKSVARQRPPAGQVRLAVLRDHAFLVFTMVDGLLASVYNDLLSVALPLWLVARTHGPLWLVSAALAVNTAGCVFLQVWAARGGSAPAEGARLGRRGALLVGGACVLFALTAGQPAWVVAVIVLLAAGVHVLGELWLSTGTWSVVFGLAPDWGHGQYQGTYFTGRQIGDMIAPPLLTVCVVGAGAPGWLVIGGGFAIAAVTYPAIVRWGLNTRPHRQPPGHDLAETVTSGSTVAASSPAGLRRTWRG